MYKKHYIFYISEQKRETNPSCEDMWHVTYDRSSYATPENPIAPPEVVEMRPQVCFPLYTNIQDNNR